MSGFSLRAGVAAQAWERKKLERPGCVPRARYISRPAVSEKRLSLTPSGDIRYRLKTPSNDSLPHERSEYFGYGATHVIFDPLDFIGKLAALVPKPRIKPKRFHDVFVEAPNGPNSKCRVDVTPAKRGKGRARQENEDKPSEQRHWCWFASKTDPGFASAIDPLLIVRAFGQSVVSRRNSGQCLMQVLVRIGSIFDADQQTGAYLGR